MAMQFYYGQQMPLRILDEAEFWKQQEEEHTVVIRELVKDLEKEYVEALKKWEEKLSETHQKVTRFIESVVRSAYYVPVQLYQQVLKLISFCLKQSLKFIELCRQIKTESEAVSKNPTAKVVLDHIIRESEYFVGIAQTLLYQNQPEMK
jgi:Txe/YoeB family toxin of Txe-Axe toxin-antitoxin module